MLKPARLLFFVISVLIVTGCNESGRVFRKAPSEIALFNFTQSHYRKAAVVRVPGQTVEFLAILESGVVWMKYNTLDEPQLEPVAIEIVGKKRFDAIDCNNYPASNEGAVVDPCPGSVMTSLGEHGSMTIYRHGRIAYSTVNGDLAMTLGFLPDSEMNYMDAGK